MGLIALLTSVEDIIRPCKDHNSLHFHSRISPVSFSQHRVALVSPGEIVTAVSAKAPKTIESLLLKLSASNLLDNFDFGISQVLNFAIVALQVPVYFVQSSHLACFKPETLRKLQTL